MTLVRFMTQTLNRKFQDMKLHSFTTKTITTRVTLNHVTLLKGIVTCIQSRRDGIGNSNMTPSFTLQTNERLTDDKISLAHVRYTFKPGDKITK